MGFTRRCCGESEKCPFFRRDVFPIHVKPKSTFMTDSSNEIVLAIAGEHKCKTLLVAPEGLYFISKEGLSSSSQFREAYEKGGVKDLLTTKKFIEWSKIKGFGVKKGRENVSLKTEGMGILDGKFSSIDFSDNTSGIETLLQYAEKHQMMRRSDVQLTGGKAVLPYLLYLLVAAGLTWAMYGVASNPAEAEAVYESHGRRSGIKKLFAYVAELLGPMGTLVVFGGGTLYCAYLAWKAFTNPPVEVRLER